MSQHVPNGSAIAVGSIDFILARIVTWVVAVLGPVAALWSPLSDWGARRPLTWLTWGDAGPPIDPGSVAEGVSATHSGQILWSQEAAGAGRWLLSLLPEVLSAVAIVLGALLVLRLISRIQSGEPFDRTSVRSVRQLGLITFGYGLFAPLMTLTVGIVLTWGVQDQPMYGFRFDASAFWPVPIGIVLVVVAQVWERGRELADDVAGLV